MNEKSVSLSRLGWERRKKETKKERSIAFLGSDGKERTKQKQKIHCTLSFRVGKKKERKKASTKTRDSMLQLFNVCVSLSLYEFNSTPEPRIYDSMIQCFSASMIQ